MFPEVTVARGSRWVEDGRIATAGGLTSGTDLALRVVERYFGRDVAQRTATQLEYQGTGWMNPESNAVFADYAAGTPEQPVCPVCGMRVAPDTPFTLDHDGVAWHFCGTWCQDQFTAAPHRFADNSLHL
jgi:YHS domain-containing protein